MSFLQVASWNIEHLGGAPRAKRKQSAFALADHIEMAGIDVIALQEIYVTPEDDEVRIAPNQPIIEKRARSGPRNSDLDLVCYLLEEHLDTPWAYAILPNRSADDTSQLCAVMWSTGRLTFASARALPVQHKDGGDSLWDRKPHLVTFTSEIPVFRRPDGGEWEKIKEKRTLNLVPLHMKSNVGGVTVNRRVRGKEAATLCEALATLKGDIDPTVMLIGDTNILNNTEPAIETFIDNDFIDLNNNDTATFWSAQFDPTPFDRAFVAKDRPEFKYSRQYVLKSADLTAHDRFLSDHYMIKVSVKDYLDDADPRPTAHAGNENPA